MSNADRVSVVIDFPNGNGDFNKISQEMHQVIDSGVDEIDLVVSNDARIADKILEIADFIKIKLILETGKWSIDELIDICEIYQSYDNITHYKTSTGKLFNTDVSEKAKHIDIMKKYKPIKVSGGVNGVNIHTYDNIGVDIFGIGYKTIMDSTI